MKNNKTTISKKNKVNNPNNIAKAENIKIRNKENNKPKKNKCIKINNKNLIKKRPNSANNNKNIKIIQI